MSEPTILQKAAHLAVAVVEHVVAGLPVVEPDEHRRRLAICRECPHFDVSQWGGACALCGCNLRRKTRWAEQRCPEQRW